MKKFIMLLSSVALFGGVSHAMEEGDEMMMEEAPSVAVMLGGSAKMGIKNVSSDDSSGSDGLSLIREYEVTFDSSGTTDGGLMFGASISFDEGASGTSSTGGTVSTATTANSGSVKESVDIWVTAAVQNDGEDDEIPAGTYVTMDADEAAAINADETTPGTANTANDVVRVRVTRSLGLQTVTVAADGTETLAARTDPISGFDYPDVAIAPTTFTDTDTNKVRNGIGSASVYVGAADGSWKLKFGTGLDAGIYKIGDIGVAGEGDSFYATNGHTIELSGSFEGADFAITSNAGADGASANEWSAGVKYNAGQVSVGVGMDSEKGIGLSVGSDVSGVSIGMIYTKAEMGEGDDMKQNSGLGVSAGIAAGEGATVTLKYSTNKTQGMGAMEKKLIEADFAYDLGGGAKFNAGVDSLDDDGSKKTTLEASISMSF